MNIKDTRGGEESLLNEKAGGDDLSLSVVGSEWKEKSPRLVGQVNTKKTKV